MVMFPEIKIERIEVKANSRRLDRRKTARKGQRKFVYRVPVMWRCEPVRDLEIHYAINAEEEFEKALMSFF